jgi:chaperonin GroES
MIELLEDRILVRRKTAVTKSAGGIIIPDTATEKPQFGDIVAVGPGILKKGKRIPVDFTAGQHVIFGKWNEDTVKIDGESLVLLREKDILGTISTAE